GDARSGGRALRVEGVPAHERARQERTAGVVRARAPHGELTGGARAQMSFRMSARFAAYSSGVIRLSFLSFSRRFRRSSTFLPASEREAGLAGPSSAAVLGAAGGGG